MTRFACGKGFGVCLPWYPGTHYWQDGHEMFRLFVSDLLQNLCGVRSVGTNLSPMVEVTHGRKDGFEVVHFVNGSGHFGNSFFDPCVLSEQSVTIPWAHESVRCENLDEPGNVAYELNNGTLKLTIPKLGFHACVVIREA